MLCQVFSVWVCFSKRCTPNEWYPLPSPSTDVMSVLQLAQVDTDTATLAALDNMAGMTGDCSDCNFLSGPGPNATCPAELSVHLCPEMTTNRLNASPDLDCDDDVWPYYGTASLLTLVCFTIGVPWLHYEVTRRHCKRYAALVVESSTEGTAGGGATRKTAVNHRVSIRASFVKAYSIA